MKCLVLEVGIWKVFVVFQFSQPFLGFLEELSLSHFQNNFTPFYGDTGSNMFNNRFHSECRTWDYSPEPGRQKTGVFVSNLSSGFDVYSKSVS